MDRLVTLSKIIETLGPIKGEKSLQKLVYLIQANGEQLGYQFRWNNFGPISFELEKEIQEIKTLGLITITHENNIPIYSCADDLTHLSTFWHEQLQSTELSDRSLQMIMRIQSLGDRRDDPLFLEVLASLDYLQRHTSKDPIQEYQAVSGNRCPSDLISAAQSTLKKFQIE